MIQLEKRVERNPELAREYRRSMHEAIEAEHLRRCSKEEVEARKNAYFIPHHPVIKQSRTTTKVRPVCDASAKSSHGSLNDRMLVGPTVHMDIFSILVRWRMFKIAYAGDCHERKQNTDSKSLERTPTAQICSHTHMSMRSHQISLCHFESYSSFHREQTCFDESSDIYFDLYVI